ncbi:sulfatase-like hydrolase/transferase [Flammeovirga yaeyamensis]|uniref:Sulfatase-like hydrolase/transferase n=1 Tax=Flammeovirga yaeyamensis TaxID=367791 RepID=A0AAX1NB44_9BACT|nr:sulfatase-like hydrolase/transferase [Flammeovirga yaeyamensis]MBB3697305.1 arylsulfatase A-like enzyme/aryl-phospho-beta-D-glucosidase BglC (GH1 family) [Flammeovirga yaeyamensis]NMF33961.1 sulfatase-like hydrolase/transferase [Flammeovirga yaeyamensis]QWG04779.1 sulfatase-like hydrolase/transferase [Flammeovirga yaeyamensis]
MKELLFILSMIFFIGQTNAQTPAQRMADRLGTGYNFGNVMSAYQEGNWGAPIQEGNVEDIANAGFRHIRLPVRWDGYTQENAPYTIDPAWLERVEQVIDWATSRGLIVILNAHGEHWFLDEVTKEDTVYPDQNKWNRMLAMWRQIGHHFRDKSNDQLIFELINEPYFKMGQSLVDELNVELLEIVRNENPDRIVMLTGGGDNAIHSPQQMNPATFRNDDKLIAWFHYYWPNQFTKHPEVKDSRPTWGTPEDYTYLENNFLEVKTWANNNNIPLYLGEFGSNNNCEEASRLLYHRAVVQTAENLGIPRTIWCAGERANKMIYNRVERTFVPGHTEALTQYTPRATVPSGKRNVLFIVVDDLNTDLFSFGNQEVITPNFDRLADEGIQYQNAQCSYPVCGPSRASMLTGTYPERNGVTNLSTLLEEASPELTTLPELLKENGYKTAAVGKVFDPRSVDDHHDTDSWTESYKDPNTYDYPQEYGDFVQGSKYRVQSGVSVEVGPVNVGDDGYQDGQFANHAMDYLDYFGTQEQPFFLAVGFKKPHLPFVAPKEYFDLYENRTLSLASYQGVPEGTASFIQKDPSEIKGYSDIPQTWSAEYNGFTKLLDLEKQRELIKGYYACASYIDAQIGKVIDKLEETGQKDNTLIIITSDHGFNLGDHNQWGKHNLLQNAAQIPMIVIDPTNNLRTSNRSVQLIDLYPTICDYTAVNKPQFLQGNSLFHQENDDTYYPMDLAVTYYKTDGSNGYSFKRGNERYTLWTTKKDMTPKGMEFNAVDIRHEEYYRYSSAQELETRNQINDANYQDDIQELRELATVWWNKYYGHVQGINQVEHQNIDLGGNASEIVTEVLDPNNFIRLNPGFEIGIQNGWTYSAKENIGIVATATSGMFPGTDSKAAAFEIENNGGAFSNMSLKSNQHSLNTSIAHELFIAFDVHSTSNTEFRVQIQGDNGDNINTEAFTVTANTTQRIKTSITTTNGMNAFKFYFQFGKTEGAIYFDNVYVSDVEQGTVEEEENEEELILASLNQLRDQLAITFNANDPQDGNGIQYAIEHLPLSIEDATVTWTSSNMDVINTTGEVTQTEQEETVTLTARIAKEGYALDKDFLITVLAKEVEEEPVEVSNLILTNPGFEDGMNIGWSTNVKTGAGISYSELNGNFPTTSSSAAGYSIQSNGGSFSNFSLKSDVHPLPTSSTTQTLYISLDVYAESDTEIKLQLKGSNDEKVLSDEITIPNGRQERVNTSLEVSSNMTDFQLLIQMGKTVGNIYFDNVVVSTEVIETAVEEEIPGEEETPTEEEVPNEEPIVDNHSNLILYNSDFNNGLNNWYINVNTTHVPENQVAFKTTTHKVSNNTALRVNVSEGGVSKSNIMVRSEKYLLDQVQPYPRRFKVVTNAYSSKQSEIRFQLESTDQNGITNTIKGENIALNSTAQDIETYVEVDANAEYFQLFVQLGLNVANFTFDYIELYEVTESSSSRTTSFDNQEDLKTNSFLVYPNPANNVINIKLSQEEKVIKIYDLLGREVLSAEDNFGKQNWSIDISKLYKGNYIIKTSNISSMIIKK